MSMLFAMPPACDWEQTSSAMMDSPPQEEATRPKLPNPDDNTMIMIRTDETILMYELNRFKLGVSIRKPDYKDV